jgi:DNA-binding MarR family transcriptional regulator
MGELAQLVLMNHPALTKLMDRIVSRGWAHRTVDASDNRKVLVFITDAGLEFAVRLRERVAQYHDAIDAGDRRTQQLKRLLGTLIRGHE